MLIFNLKKKWFDKIKNGEKTHEYREVKPYWKKRLCNELDVSENELKELKLTYEKHIVLVCGYSNFADDRLPARLYSVTIRNGKNTDLKVDKDIYDLEFEIL